MSAPAAAIARYLSEVDKLYRSGKAAEHSCRPALKALFEALTSGLTISYEPKRIACGAPAYIITKGDIPAGYIEAKGISAGLHTKQHKEQFDRYKQALNNLIITDYLTFELFGDGLPVLSVSIAREKDGTIQADTKQYPAFLELLDKFTGYSGKTIYTSEQLAKVMAGKAKLLAAIIQQALKDKHSEKDGLSGQLEAFRKILIHDLRAEAFADIYAQTLAYGLFAARLNQKDKQQFTRYLAPHLIPQSNPFLRNFFNDVAGINLDSRIAWIVDALADLFNRVAVEELLKEFAKASQDPFIHFYETFLAEYDPKLRESRGVYYTPLPVVRFMVQAVDDILQQEFNLSKGLADNSKIKRTIQEADGTQKQLALHKVQILDPAAGTGTFLAEVIGNIYERFARQKGLWAGYCAEHLIPRLNGFELLMAPYAMAHFKLGMMLEQTGYRGAADKRIRVYLTNSLEEPEGETALLLMEKWLSDEAAEANGIKRDTPVMVVIGNPPYSGESANCTKEEFLQAYKKEPGGVEKLNEKNSKWLNDDYVKFIRYGQNFIEKHGEGVVAYINNHSFLDNPTFRGMRWNLLSAFDKIYILDLHGNAKKRETSPDGGKDENVFDIQQGVSVNIFIKTGGKKDAELAEVFHYDVYGSRKAKYAFLLENNLAAVPYRKINPTAPQYFFVAKDFSSETEYAKGLSVQDLFPVNSLGLLTKRDNLSVSFNTDEQVEKLSYFLNTKNNLSDVCEYFDIPLKDKDRWDASIARKNTQFNEVRKNIFDIMYRPFDIRKIFYNEYFVARLNRKVLRNLQAANNAIIIGRQGQALGNAGNWNIVYITNSLVDQNIFYRGGGTVFPLYLYSEADTFERAEPRRPNLNDGMVTIIARKTGLRFTAEKEKTEDTFAPIDILDYIYAVLHSPAYRETYREFLKIDFPRVPYPKNAEQFTALAALGAALRGIHLLETANRAGRLAGYPIEGNNTVDKPEFRDAQVWINKQQYFDEVPRNVWDFSIGGYQPARKWLKDRKGRSLTDDEIAHYQKMVSALHVTMETQARIDEVLR
ncbi:MAG: N-6 DNA methylase [Treponema sp.]|jgi:predicted helicase|nr:N-6 DNA methylase [Treponema sp.]